MGRKSSSSSLKKKKGTYKHSSRGRSRKKTKTSRNKPKKYGHRHDSSSYTDDYSRSSVSVSSSSSEDSYRRRSRSRTRKDIKLRKKSARESSSSSEDSHVRKHKRPKRTENSDVRKRTHKNLKRKPKRDVSTSSRNSRSVSCSSCQSLSSDSDASEYGKRRGRPKTRGKNQRDSGKSKKKRYRERSKSCSSDSSHTESSDYGSEERGGVGYYSKRLRSVITVNHGIQTNSDELIYDLDDYPSGRSNDSNSRGNEMDLIQKLQLPAERGSIKDNKREDAVTANNDNKASELLDIKKEDREGQKDINETETSDAIRGKKKVTSYAGDSATINDLETILRQKALENLKRFRNRSQATTKDPVNLQDQCDARKISPSTASDEPTETNLTDNDSERMVKMGSNSLKQEAMVLDRENVGRDSLVSAEKEVLSSTTGVQWTSFESNQAKLARGNGLAENIPKSAEIMASLGDTNCVAMKEVDSSNQLNSNDKKNVSSTVRSSINRPRLFMSALNQSLSKTTANPANSGTSIESVQAKTTKDNGLGAGAPQSADVAAPPSSNCRAEIPKNASTSTSAENSRLGEGKIGSDLEQKTMSVMRGGEMVQVNYKVYIPKRSPALARRPLKR